MSISAFLHQDHGSHIELFTRFGAFGEFVDDVLLHGFTELLTIVPLLFLTYLLMEFIEHKAGTKVNTFMRRAGVFGPALGSILGVLPQCGFSASASNLYTGRVITLGTLIAVFLSTSDEMLPIFLAGNINITKVLLIIVYKVAVAMLVGFIIDLVMRLLHRGSEEIDIDAICDEDGCHCENGILRSALHHTLSVSVWCLVIILGLNTLVFFVGEETIGKIIIDIPVLSHIICAIIGLIPNCAASVALSKLAIGGFITTGEMLAGLFSAAGVGMFVLFRVNKRIKENLAVIGIVVAVGVVFGFIADFIPWLQLA